MIGERLNSPLKKGAVVGRWLMVLGLLLASPAWALDAGGDLAEFATPEDARAFGWSSSGGAPVEVVADAGEGETALRVEGGPDAKPYTGMLLKHAVDLSHAGPGDKIVFSVKQNYKSGIYLNIHTQEGHIYRSTSLKTGAWTRKVFSLDLARHAPEHWDGRVWLSVGSEWAAPDRRLTAAILAVNDELSMLPEAR